ncbi:MAG TPA: class II aldolase/adducin family protein, partial [Acidothermaceae bacterium]
MTAPPHSVGAIRTSVAQLHAELLRWGLVVWTAGNVSARVPGEDLFVIKPSGISYDELTPQIMIVCDLDGQVVDGDHAPSSDTAAHAYVYRAMPDVGGIVHTHSTWATAWAQARREIPVLGTTHADLTAHPIPLTRELSAEEISADYERATGGAVVEALA